MYAEISAPHHTPHFHAYYQDRIAVFSMASIDMISGLLPKRQQRLVEAWAELHEAELLTDWNLLQTGPRPILIEPLK
ncbi:MAG: DUF4160 domain-containing protein [Acidobacteria bacterium]|nr:DUF4160 domain-containing protein [Acidobacteriota bacterium]MBI3655646.1 DUF4160 domain-containing protein [Acidobacteriota bacterium]